MTEPGIKSMGRIAELAAKCLERELDRLLETMDETAELDLRRLKDMVGVVRDIEAIRSEALSGLPIKVIFAGNAEDAAI